MALIRFLIAHLIFIGVLTSAFAVVLAGILMLRFPPILITVGTAYLLFHWVLKRLLRIGLTA